MLFFTVWGCLILDTHPAVALTAALWPVFRAASKNMICRLSSWKTTHALVSLRLMLQVFIADSEVTGFSCVLMYVFLSRRALVVCCSGPQGWSNPTASASVTSSFPSVSVVLGKFQRKTVGTWTVHSHQWQKGGKGGRSVSFGVFEEARAINVTCVSTHFAFKCTCVWVNFSCLLSCSPSICVFTSLLKPGVKKGNEPVMFLEQLESFELSLWERKYQRLLS